ncbi:electron transfer flavoprotein subunit alpha/FixB family protein [Chromobacterium alkanivorans]|uniref:electron transfer flavoprotein subunit alpha/FixB family protein n=1 Tax=Chromobacterium alkanivorans TaxID=1071719 RepID=UPI001967000F|nr:electron transfer flavoprotein subunit alpha/FixB family protein [Chromobacterium alkanivorans]MBN3006501.1 electron transfer flavoprotein subunit alpha/FixB family protein [Chromobacterium alkanivorans]
MKSRTQTAPRVDPRRPWVRSPGGLKRIVLGEDGGRRDAPPAASMAAAKPLRSAGPFDGRVLVVAHAERGQLDEAAREAIAAAALLAGPREEVLAVLFGMDGCADAELAELALDRALTPADPGFAPEAKLALLRRLWRQETPRHILFADRGDDADLGRRFACRERLSVLTDIVEIAADGARRRRPGAGFSVHAPAETLLLARGVADARLPFVGLGRRQAGATEAAAERVRDLGSVVSPASQLALEEADLILAAGNGVSDVPAFLRLAATMGAAVGASRVAVDDGRFRREQQVGATGRSVQASAYLALGISGAVQHLQGIKACRHVIAVNLDAAAPMVKRADLSVIDDCQSFIHALQALLEREGKEARS